MLKEKTLFLLSYYYPPYADVSGIRASKFAKYLPCSDWTPWVFTVHPSYYGAKISPEASRKNGKTTLIRIPYVKIPGRVILVKLLFPLLALLFIIKNKKKINAVFITGSPFHPFLLTFPITQILRIPTILDFRDSWSINHGFDGKKANTWLAILREKILIAVEKFSIKYASWVIFATSVLQDEYHQKHQAYAYKFSTIPNGFDPEDFEQVTEKTTIDSKRLIITGKFHLYTPEVVENLMIALKNYPTIHFVYAGNEHEIIKKLAQGNAITERVKTFPFLASEKVLQMIAASGVTLMTNGMVNGMGTKIFEYLALGKPVICLVPEGSIIVKEFGTCSTVLISHPPHSHQKIETLLRQAFSLQANSSSVDVSMYNRRVLTQKLAHLLDSIS